MGNVDCCVCFVLLFFFFGCCNCIAPPFLHIYSFGLLVVFMLLLFFVFEMLCRAFLVFYDNFYFLFSICFYLS